MKSVIVSGKTIEKAIEEGLSLLNTTFENVDIKVISEGGFLKKATVEVTLSEDAIKEKQQKQNKLEKLEEKYSSKTEDLVKTKEVKTPKRETATKETEKEKPAKETEEFEDSELSTQIESLEEEIKQLQGNDKSEVLKEEHFVTAVSKDIEEFLTGLLNIYSIIAKIETTYKEREFKVKIVGENLGVLIGYHGEALDAIQYILSNYIYNKTNRNHRIILDIENYRQKRADALKLMAESLAKKVVEAKKSFKLEPMNSFERKVIHTHLQDLKNISTHSEGVEPKRYLVIEYVD